MANWRSGPGGGGGAPPPPGPGSWNTYALSLAPTLWYPMNEPSGLVAHDASGNGNNGAYAASGVTYGVSGPVTGDTAVSFDGTTGCITSSFTPSATSGFTIVQWFKGLPASWPPQLCCTNDCYHNGSGWQITIGWLGGNYLVQGGGYNDVSLAPQAIITLPSAPLSGWHMLSWRCGMFVDVEGNKYVAGLLGLDGADLAAGSDCNTGGYLPSGNPILIGKPYGSDSYLDASTGQFVYWDSTVLTAQQIAYLYGSA